MAIEKTWFVLNEDSEPYQIKRSKNGVESYTKDQLIDKFKELAKIGWVKGRRKGNCGSAGNTLEDFLGIEENNLPIPNAAEWELKTHKLGSTALMTLGHIEPSPRAMSLVSNMLLPNYGWAHKEAGKKYGDNELSFRQTINGLTNTDRGCIVVINYKERKVEISFDSSKVDSRHSDWLKSVDERIGLNDFNPRPYWGFDDLEHALGTKLHNCFYALADVKKVNGEEYYWYRRVLMLKSFKFEKFLECVLNGSAYVDFDARTGHNHGTKFRIRQNKIPELYGEIITVVDI